MNAYLRHIPEAPGRPAYIFCTKALYAGNALRRAAGFLTAGGYAVLGSAEVVMPGSDGLVFLARDSAAVKKLCGRDFTKIAALDRLAETIAAGPKTGGRTPEKSRGGRLPSKLAGAAADGLFRPVFGPLTRLMAGKFRTDESCIRCGLCARICPAHNIRVMEDGVSFGGRCCLCMRCINQCPQAAIQIGRGTVGKMRWKGPDGDFDPLRQNEG
jgi:ferredoxin